MTSACQLTPIENYGAVIAAGRASAGEGFAQRVFSGKRRHGFPLSTMTKSNAITMHAATAAMTAPDVTKANGFNIGTTLTRRLRPINAGVTATRDYSGRADGQI